MAINKVPINRGTLSGGMNNRHIRREFLRFNREVDKYNLKKEKVDKRNVLNKMMLKEDLNEDTIIMENLPKLKNLKLFLR